LLRNQWTSNGADIEWLYRKPTVAALDLKLVRDDATDRRLIPAREAM